MTTPAPQPVTLDGVNRATRALSETIRWGASAAHPGLGDTAHATAEHMGGVLNRIRDLYFTPRA